MGSVPETETKRQYRVLQQTLSCHSLLRDRATWKAKVAKSILLGLSILFSVTTFAGYEFYTILGVEQQSGKIAVGFASVMAIIASVVLLIFDWEGEATRHGEAAKKWAAVLEEFRVCREDDGLWPEDAGERLNVAYWEAARNTPNIPERRFNKLKSKHLRKVAVSKLTSEYPGCPRFLLWASVRMGDTIKALRRHSSTHDSDNSGS